MKSTARILACIALAALSASAANLQWDGDPGTADAQDGSGTWNLSNSNWTNGTGNVVWDNHSTAVFGNGNGTPGSGVFTVSLAGDTSVTNITFKSAGTGNSYLIDNPDAILTLLTGGAVLDTITVNPGVSAEINTILATSGSSTANVRTIGGGNLKLSGGTAANPSSIYFLSVRNGATMELAGNMVCSNNLMASGGTLVLSGTNRVMNAFYTGDSGNGGNDLNVINVTGGVTTLQIGNSTSMYLGKKNTTNSVNISGGSLAFAAGNTRPIYLASDFNGASTVSNIVSSLNISGTGLLDTGTGSGTIFMLANGNNTVATVNLDGGTLATARQITTGTIGTHTSIFNFNGGLLKANSDQENLMFGADSPFQALSGVYARDGGAIFDTTLGNLGVMHDILHSTNTLDSATDGGVTVSGNGALTLGGNNTYTGPTVVKSGAICMASPTAVPGYLTGSLTVSNGAAFGVRLGSDSSITQPDFDAIISSSTIFDAAGKNVAIAVSGNGGAAVDTSAIGDLTGSRGLVKVGAGTLQMLGSYTYTAPTIVSGGKLQLVSGATTPPSSGYVINPLGVIQVGDGSTPGSGDLGVNSVTNNGGKLTFNRPDSYVVTNRIIASAGACLTSWRAAALLSATAAAPGPIRFRRQGRWFLIWALVVRCPPVASLIPAYLVRPRKLTGSRAMGIFPASRLRIMRLQRPPSMSKAEV